MKVHINQLPLERNYVVLREEVHDKVVERLKNMYGSAASMARNTGISINTTQRLCNRKCRRISINYLLKIMNILNITLENVENNIMWVGALSGNGIHNPKLPFDFNTRAAARFLAGICNEGWISDGMYYSNSNNELRDSVRRDTLSVFGGDRNTVKEWIRDKDQYLSFTSIIRDAVQMITGFKGVKADNNPPVPPFILGNKELIYGWIEQTIADEGHVKYYPNKYRREIIWRRAFSKDLTEHKLNRDEQKMLNKIEIDYDIKNIGSYKTQDGRERIKLHIRISKRENIWKLRNLIKIPNPKKDKMFTDMVNNFMRYKGPLIVKDKTIKICNDLGYVTSSELRKEMNYKNTNCALKWLKLYVQQGWLKCIAKSCYGIYKMRAPAKYALVEP